MVFVGKEGCGKTTLIHSFLDQKYNSDVPRSLSAEFYTADVNDKRFGIWDTSGNPRYEQFLHIHVKTCDVLVLCSDDIKDLTDKGTYNFLIPSPIERQIGVVKVLLKSDMHAFSEDDIEVDNVMSAPSTIFYVNSENMEGVNELFEGIAMCVPRVDNECTYINNHQNQRKKWCSII